MSSNSDVIDILNEILKIQKNLNQNYKAPEPEPQSAPEPEPQST